MNFNKANKRKYHPSVDDSQAMFPIMSLLVILIPFLVGNLAFYQLKSISVTTPGLSKSDDSPEEQKRSQRVMVQLLLDRGQLEYNLIAEDTGDILRNRRLRTDAKSLKYLTAELNQYRRFYKKFETLLVTVGKKVKYKQLVTVLEEIKIGDKDSDSKDPELVGKAPLNVVMMSKGEL